MTGSFGTTVSDGVNTTVETVRITVYADGQWASTVLGASSDNDNADDATGAPDGNLWTPTNENTFEFLTVEFTTAAYATGLRIQGADGGGGIQMVELIEANGTNHKIWFGDDIGSDDGSGDFVLRFPLTGYEVKSARIWTSGSIDAVQLITEDTWAYTYTGSEITKQENNHTGETWTYGYTSGKLTHVEKRTTDAGTLELEADYVYDGSGNETERTIWTPDAKNHVVRHDGYSVAKITDPFDDMIVLDEINYDDSGNVISRTNEEFDGTYKWSTREVDAEINLLFNTANYLDAATGRWIAVGAAKTWDAGDSVLCRYVEMAPVISLDASVLQTVPSFTLDILKLPTNELDDLFANLSNTSSSLTKTDLAVLLVAYDDRLSRGIALPRGFQFLANNYKFSVQGLGRQVLYALPPDTNYPVKNSGGSVFSEKLVKSLIVNLDSNLFSTRQKAEKALKTVAHLILGDLVRANYEPLSLEQSRRIDQIIDSVPRTSYERLVFQDIINDPAIKKYKKTRPSKVENSRSHALRGNARSDALRHGTFDGDNTWGQSRRGASWSVFPRRAWEQGLLREASRKI